MTLETRRHAAPADAGAMQRLTDRVRSAIHAIAQPRSRGRMMTVLGWIAAIAFVFYVAPADAGLPEANEVPLTAVDGTQIHVWHVAPRDNKPVIIYFHGNGGSLPGRVDRFRRLIKG